MPMQTDHSHLWGRTHSIQTSTCGRDRDSLHTSPRKARFCSTEYQRLLRSLWGCRTHSNREISCSLAAHLHLQHNQEDTKTPSHKAWLLTRQPPSHSSACKLCPSSMPRAGERCLPHQLEEIPHMPCLAEAASQHCATFPAHLREAAANPKRHYLTCHRVTSLTASNGKGTGEKCCKLINIRPLVAVCYCKQTF